MPNDDNIGDLQPTKCWGGMVAAKWNITPAVFSTVQCSYMRNYIPRYTIASATTYDHQIRHGYSITANAVWRISSLFSAGVEYCFAHRTNCDLTALGNNRVYGMLMMNF